LTNADLERMVDTSDEWITERTGIKERHIVTDSEATSDIAYPACVRALEDGDFAPEDLDTIICATVTPDNPFPSTACKLQARLGAHRAFAFDVAAACSGWIYALGLAQGLMQAEMARHVLILGAELLSKITDWTDRSTCVLFGDGAGATLLGTTTERIGLLSCCLASDGRHYDLLYQPAGGTRLPPSVETVENRQHTIRMNGNEVFKFAVRNMVDLSRCALEQAGTSLDEVDLLIPHQANRRIMDQTVKRLGLPPEKAYVNLNRYGNTSAASVPMALDEARREGRIGPGSVVAVVAFGGGFTYGAAVLKL
jgi:3-oxoacyl-[acyl-carrier-protein] synthase-3